MAIATTPAQPNPELVDLFEEFYQDRLREEIGELAEGYPKDTRSLYIEARDLYTYDQSLLDDWQQYPREVQEAAEEALRLYDLPIDIDLSGAHVRLTDSEEIIERVPLADIDDRHIGRYVAIRGQLSRITGKIPRINTGVFICQRCGSENIVEMGERAFQEPYQCESCERSGPFKLHSGRSELTKIRKIKLEETPEERVEQNGQSQAVFVEDDLCEYGGTQNGLADHGGELVTVFAEVMGDDSHLKNGVEPELETWLKAHAIRFEDDDLHSINVEDHKEEFEAVAEAPDTIEQLKASIAPTLKADDDLDAVLEACVAWLFNGYRADPAGLGTFRGDLHMCLIGDPGLGKSTLLSNLHHLCPTSEYRSGTGLTEVGLTAAAIQEEFAGKSEWTLVPGVLPRANGGHCLIDEVDGVIGEKTKAIHDALEGDQEVKVDKAGIKANLPTRTALLASGNPVDGRFDRNLAIPPQIDLDPALISRMDVLFALQDIVDEGQDREKARHILDSNDELMQMQVAESHGVTLEEEPSGEHVEGPVPKEVFRAMIHYARENIHPLLTPEAKDRLEEFYVEARNLNDGYQEDNDTIPATPRTLGAGIRLSVAFARAELSETVEVHHAERAIGISRRVVGLNFDPESGEFDAGRVDTSGRKKPRKDWTQEERRKRLVEIVRQLQPDVSSEGGADRVKVIDRLSNEGADRGQVEHDLETMTEAGEFYEPANGEVRKS